MRKITMNTAAVAADGTNEAYGSRQSGKCPRPSASSGPSAAKLGCGFAVLCLFLAIPFLRAQTPLDPEKLVDQWFIRLNALDDWYISYDGKEETDAVVDRFVELYDRDAFHQVGPNENQIGPVVFHGPDGIKKWATDFAKKHVQLAYRVDMMTRNEKTAQLVYSVKPPWGGIAAAVEFTAVYTNREDRKRIMIPGSAFFVFDDSGKILRLRLYMLRDETAEIEQ
jgi:hypothetical protein